MTFRFGRGNERINKQICLVFFSSSLYDRHEFLRAIYNGKSDLDCFISVRQTVGDDVCMCMNVYNTECAGCELIYCSCLVKLQITERLFLACFFIFTYDAYIYKQNTKHPNDFPDLRDLTLIQKSD